MLIAITLKVYISNSPKNKTIPNNKNIVVLRGITIFLKDYLGNLLNSKKDVTTKNIGTIKS